MKLSFESLAKFLSRANFGKKAKKKYKYKPHEKITLERHRLEEIINTIENSTYHIMKSEFDTNSGAYEGRGQTKLNVGMYLHAKHDFSKAIKIKPDFVEAYLGRAHACNMLGEFEQAIEDLNAAANLKQDDLTLSRIFERRAQAFRGLERYDFALEDLLKSLHLSSILYEYKLKDIAELYEVTGEKKLAKYYRELLERVGSTLKSTGEILWQQKERIKVKPNDAEAHYAIGAALKERRKIDAELMETEPSEKTGQEMLEHFNKTIELKPKHAEARYERSLLRIEKGDLEDALEDLNIAINQNPNILDAYHQRGKVLNYLGRDDEAVKDYEKASDLKKKLDKCAKKGRIRRWLGRNKLATGLAGFVFLMSSLIVGAELSKQSEEPASKEKIIAPAMPKDAYYILGDANNTDYEAHKKAFNELMRKYVGGKTRKEDLSTPLNDMVSKILKETVGQRELSRDSQIVLEYRFKKLFEWNYDFKWGTKGGIHMTVEELDEELPPGYK